MARSKTGPPPKWSTPTEPLNARAPRHLKRRIVREAKRRKVSVAQIVVERLCESFGIDP